MDTARLLRRARETAPPVGTDPADTELLRRYAAERDEAAFAELVRRNGPLVLRTCRHVLGEAGAEDAFQATFLLLARSAGRLTRSGSLAGWLHAAAVRVAHRARRGESRRREREVASRTPPVAPDDLTWREVREVLDTELAALPEKYRVPLVLCYLQELSYEEAARRAGCPVGALRGRLERGKERLRKRLARYGLPLAAPAIVVGSPSPVSAALIEAAVAAVRTAKNGTVPPALAGLLPTGRLRVALLFAPAATALAAIGIVLAASGSPTADPPRSDPPEPARPAAEADPHRPVDRHGDPLPTGAVMCLGTARLRHGGYVQSVAFSPDGAEVASAGDDHTVRIWDRQTGRELRRLKGPFIFPNAVAYADGGTRIVTAEGLFSTPLSLGPTPVRLWDARTGELVRVLAESGPRTNEPLAVSPDGKTVAFRTGDTVVLHPVAKGGRSGKLSVRNRYVPALAFSPDGTRLVVCFGQGFGNWQAGDSFGVRLFDLTLLAEDRKPEPLWVRGAEVDMIGWQRDPTALFSPDGKHVLVSFGATEEHRAPPLLLDAGTGKDVRPFAGQKLTVYPFLFLQSGKQVVGGSYHGPSVVWDVATGKIVAEPPWEDLDVIGGAVLSPDGKTIATAGRRAVRLWDTATWKELCPTPASIGEIDRLVVAPDGRRVLAVSDWNPAFGARLWDLDTGRQVSAVPGRGWFVSQVPNSKSKLLFGSGGDGDFRAWDAQTLNPLPHRKDDHNLPQRNVSSLEVTPDGARFVAAGTDGVLGVWDRATRTVVCQVDTGRRGAWPFALSADGRFAVTGPTKIVPGFGGVVGSTAIKAWNLETGKLRAAFDGPETGANCLAVAPDDRTVAVGTHHGGVRVYELATGKCRAEFRGHEGGVTAAAFTPDGRRLISGGSDTQILVWDLLGPLPGRAGPADAGRAWADLLSSDAARADRAMRHFASAPAAAVTHFQKHLVADQGPDPKRVQKLVEQLAAPEFADREAAQAELERIGPEVVPALRDAIRAAGSAEVVSRAGELVNKLDPAPVTGEALRHVRAVEVLERIGSADARNVLSALATGAAGARVTREAAAALARLRGRN
ncbi:sigma-70 family RNA polymerase sigma factor [Frigoriglobus tundricola]|uniref:ECF RNA polymerase sigma factor SigE n=1 Tax=Frigoriglobus tundricola TaxID=2774151 RepID=A0A6M5YPD9_9BACT|nr:sigma-70 family RNA polymerase sigma factor [Frigoriglobus tundricola]QJW95270.1 hypothetical protein FTUN_2812 [Frigoriglobus tundricola]